MGNSKVKIHPDLQKQPSVLATLLFSFIFILRAFTKINNSCARLRGEDLIKKRKHAYIALFCANAATGGEKKTNFISVIEYSISIFVRACISNKQLMAVYRYEEKRQKCRIIFFRNAYLHSSPHINFQLNKPRMRSRLSEITGRER